MNKIAIVFILISCFSCTGDGVEKKGQEIENKKGVSSSNSNKQITSADADDLEIKDTESFKNGIVISWLKHGKGELVKKGDVIDIDYKVTLQDGRVIDGNHLMKRDFLPFVVGFQMQTIGWDLALSHLKVGDFARIKIPSELARGSKGIKKEGENGWFVPPNSVNYLTIRILKSEKPTRVVDGTKVWVIEENNENKITFNKHNVIEFHSIIISESNPNYFNSYRSNTTYKLLFSDRGIVPGLKKALINAKKSDRMFVIIPSKEAFGEKGSLGVVKPNEDLFYNILVMDVLEK